MLSFEQFRTLTHNLIRLYKNGCALQQIQSVKNPILSNIEKTIPILLAEAYGNVVSGELVSYIKEDSEYSLEEIHELIDDHCKLISKDSATTLWKLKELYPNDKMFEYFSKITSNE